MSKAFSIERVRAILLSRNLLLTSKEYINQISKISYKCCACGFLGDLRLNDLLQKNVGCRKCSTIKRASQRKLTASEINQTLSEKNLIRIGSRYANVATPLNLECMVCKNQFQTPLLNIRAGTGCPSCSNSKRSLKQRLSADEVQQRYQSNGKTIISPISDYKNSYSRLLVRNNKCGCEYFCSIQALNKTGVRCGKCSVTAKIPKEEYESEAQKWNGRIISIARRSSFASTWWCPDNGGHEFERSLTNIKQTQSFCNVCSSSTAELRLKALVEKLFGKPFLKVRPKNMVSRKGVPIEFDLFNAELKIAVEHHGAHHFRPQSNWSGDEGFRVQLENDAIRREYSSKNGILLIEIPELGVKTSLNEAREIIGRILRETGREIPLGFYEVEIEKLKFRSRVQHYLVRVKEAAKACGLTLVSQGYQHADRKIRIACTRCGNEFLKTPRSIIQGRGCPTCKLVSMRKPVQISDGRVFASGSEAALALGTTKESINKAARYGTKVCGLTIKRI